MARRDRRPAQRGGAATQPPRRSGARAAPVRSRWNRPGARVWRRVSRLVRRRPIALAAALALLHVAFALLTFEPRPHTGGDNGAYITLGRSLLEHGTYTELWDPAEPPHTKYPPVFPAILAIAMAAGLVPFVQLKLVVLAFSAAAVAFSFLWLRARRRGALALGIGILLAIAPGVLREGRWILSDVPFWAFTMIALWALERLRPNDWARFAVAAGAILLAYFTRSAGLPLVIAALAWLGWRRHWRQFATLAAVIALPVLLWWLRTRAYGPSGYVNEFWFIDPYLPALGTIGVADMFARMGANLVKYATIHMPVLLAGSRGALFATAGTAIAGLAFAGWLLRVRRPRASDLFVLFYLGLILIWPAVWSGERFLLPLLPLLLALAAETIMAATRRLAPGHDLRAVTLAGVLTAFMAVPGLVAGARTGLVCTGRYLDGDPFPCLGNPYHEDFFRFSTAMGDALAPDAVVLNRKPRLFYVLSGGLKSAIYPLSEDPTEFFRAADEAGATHVLFDRLDGVAELYLRPVLAERARAFCLMWASEDGTVLFAILPGGADALPMTAAELESGDIGFSVCGDEFWRSAETRRLYQRF
jgi:hypothetical protein